MQAAKSAMELLSPKKAGNPSAASELRKRTAKVLLFSKPFI
jgi:hypothetical protein